MKDSDDGAFVYKIMQSLAPESQRYMVRFILAAAVSAAAAWIGFLLIPHGGSATLMWPPSAIGIAVLFLYGYDLWPALLISIFGAFLLRNGNIPLDLSVSLADTLEAFLGAYFLRVYVEFNPLLARLRDSLGLLIACIMPTLVSALVITISSYLMGRIPEGQFELTLSSVWIGHAVTALSFTPFLIRWLYRPLFSKNRREIIEGLLIFGSIAVFSILIFWTPYGSIGPVSLVYVLIIPLMIAALRTGPRGTTLALAILAGLGTTGVIYGHSPVSGVHNSPTIFFIIQVLIGVLDLIFIVVTSIVEERKEAVVQLQASIAELQIALEKIKSEDQAKTNFLAILAHELRNPLAPIVTSVELLQGDPRIQSDPGLLDIIGSHARTMSLLLDDLLDISRITQHTFELRRDRVALSEALNRSLESVGAFIKSRGHELKVLMPAEDLYLDADPVRIEQVLVNLLVNAGKYTDPGGRISITCAREGGLAVVRVADNGIGIAPEKLRGIFEAFGQRGTVVRQPGGLGVGLSLTKQLVELHGGTVEAHSRGLGQGSTFTVRLPLSVALKRTPSAASLTFVDRIRGKAVPTAKKIVLVDDNEPAAKGLAALLSRRGHTVSIALTGEEALKKVAAEKPDLLILDIGLPDIDGYEVAKRLRGTASRPEKIIALTGYGQDNDKTKGAEAGFDAHLVKPVSLKDIEELL